MSDISPVSIQTPDGKTRASFIAGRGGMISSLVMQGPEGERELLYLPQSFDLKNSQRMGGGAPFCFPICGRLSRKDGDNRYLYEAKTYAMEIHGFGFRLPWEVAEKGNDFISLRLRHSEQTLAQYPFQFEVVLTYRLKHNQLICEQSYVNVGSKPMPYYAGFHPYLRVPFPKEQVYVDYKPVKRLQYNAGLNDIVGEADRFKVPAALTLPELNESLVQLGADKKVVLRFPDSSHLEIEAKGVENPDLFPYVQLYHIPTEPFLCIEPWMGFPNAINTVSGVRWLMPGQREHGVFYLSLAW
jgi:galactose mutarotase-like enzyme